MKIVVLGASGQVGSVIYSGLKDIHEVTGTSRNRSGKYLQFDPFSDDWSVLGKADVLINCVGQIAATPKSSFDRIHVLLTKQILAHRQNLGNPRIIQISALGASTDHQVEFLRTKGIADELLLQHPNVAVIRPSIICTPRTMLVKKMIMLSELARVFFGFVPIPRGFLTTQIQPIMPDDLIDLVRKLCYSHNTRIIPAVGPEPISFHEVIQILRECRHEQLKVIEVSKRFTDIVVKNFVGYLLPKIISTQQYQLLFEDNTADVETIETF
ncbi:MAG TPA: hypothetical protein VD884_10065 [Ohtaekwangia sp.]|nr:hypothetical protein [Ohtaekwangia sp.]